MNNWGMNTVGNWSDAGLGQSNRIASVATLEAGVLMQELWGYLMFMLLILSLQLMKLQNVSATPEKRSLPFRLFVGNEPAWPGREAELTQVILNGEESPIKDALKSTLQKAILLNAVKNLFMILILKPPKS